MVPIKILAKDDVGVSSFTLRRDSLGTVSEERWDEALGLAPRALPQAPDPQPPSSNHKVCVVAKAICLL